MMKKIIPAANPDEYVQALDGWRADLVRGLRAAVRGAAELGEIIKWGHLVYFNNGPVLLIRAEEARVLFGFWRGQRLTEMEPRLKGSGKYEMATLQFREGMAIKRSAVRLLVKEAVLMNQTFGDPTHAAKPAKKSKTATRTKPPNKAVKRKRAPNRCSTRSSLARPFSSEFALRRIFSMLNEANENSVPTGLTRTSRIKEAG